MSVLGTDKSGQGNHLVSANILLSDKMLDRPSNNFCTVNPTDVQTVSKLKEGNLQCEPGMNRSRGTFAVSTGKWYFELLMKDQSSGALQVGIAGVSHKISADDGNEFVRISHPSANGNGIVLKVGGTDTDNLGAVVNGDILGVAFDMDAQEISFLENNAAIAANSTDVDFSGLSNTGTMAPHIINSSGRRSVANFGQDSSFAGNKTAQGNTDGNGFGDFFYEPPSGYLALCTKNLSEPLQSGNHFNTVLYTGNASTNAITGVGFQPDFTWIKDRGTLNGDYNYHHALYDSVRGVTKHVRSSTTGAEGSESASLTAFGADGFTLGNHVGQNEDDEGFVSWNWKAGNANTAFSESGNNPGGTHRANVPAGFSIVSYTGTGANGTVAHGMGVAPELIFIKNRDVADEWNVYYGDNTDYLVLDDTDATADSATRWNDTSPSSTVFTVSTDHSVNADGEKYIAYCFRSIDGHSKIGEYRGNGNADGPFANTGFRPAFVILKRIDSASSGHWLIKDSKRDEVNGNTHYLEGNDSDAEADNTVNIDYLANGFKQKSTNNINNANNSTYIFYAVAETPFKYANAR